jgi:hypothetical protein
VGGCASAGATGPGSADGAASIVPSNAVAFVAASTDLSSSQWHTLGNVFLKRFEAQTKLSFANDVKPALGNEVDVALLPGKKVVGFVQPSDSAKLDAFLSKHKVASRTIGDWTAIAQDAATLATVAGAKGHLSDSPLFTAAMKRLPSDALVRAYADGDAALQLFTSIPGQFEWRSIPPGAKFKFKKNAAGVDSAFGVVGAQGFDWLAASLTGTDGGLKLEAFAANGGLRAARAPRLAEKPIAPYVPALIDEIPAGALAVVDFQVPLGAFELMPKLPAGVQKALGPLANTLPNQLDSMLGGETALYVRPGFPIPEVTLVTQPADTARASTTLDDLLRSIPKKSMLSNLQLHRAAIGGQFVVSTTQKGIDDFRSSATHLSADPSFLEAKKQSGMPAEVTGFVYANVKAVLPLLALAGAKLPADLPQLGTLAAFGAQSTGESTFTAFLGVG